MVALQLRRRRWRLSAAEPQDGNARHAISAATRNLRSAGTRFPGHNRRDTIPREGARQVPAAFKPSLAPAAGGRQVTLVTLEVIDRNELNSPPETGAQSPAKLF